jgi:hypothetical protein
MPASDNNKSPEPLGARSAADIQTERAIILAIESNPLLSNALLVAATTFDPADMERGESILNAVIEGIPLEHANLIADVEAPDWRMTPFERLVYKGAMPDLADYMIRNHGQDIAERAADGRPLTRIAGSDAMWLVIYEAVNELKTTGALQPFDLVAKGLARIDCDSNGPAGTSAPPTCDM